MPDTSIATDPVATTAPVTEAVTLDAPADAEQTTVPGDAAEEARDGATVTDDRTKDTAKNDTVTGAPVARGALAEATTNGTPAASKPNANGSTKKKSSAIPEHRSKALKKKKSKPVLHFNVVPGELYLARLKGHQPWPAIIAVEEMLPDGLLKTRPVTTAQADGTYGKAEYEDGGKRANERTYPTMFLHTNEFAWIANSELTPLKVEDCQDILEKGKSKGLIEAYKIAAKGHDLEFYKLLIRNHKAAREKEAVEKAERAAAKANKAKSKRKSMDVAADEDADAMDVDDEAAETKPKSKKRKKSLGSEGIEEKPAKTPKTATKLKLTNPKTPAEVSAKKRAAKAKSSTKKSAPKVDGSDDEMTDTPKIEEKPLTPAEAKEKKEKEIRYYRHKLQKGFLSRDTVPSDDEIKLMSGFLAKLETYLDLEGSIIRATKIHKVLKAMIRLTSIPKDEDFQFKTRAHDLLIKWNKILAEDPKDDKDDKDDDLKPEPVTTNGTSESAKAGEPDEGAAKPEGKADSRAVVEKPADQAAAIAETGMTDAPVEASA